MWIKYLNVTSDSKKTIMEYFRDPKNQIYADLAYRMGKIVVQYEKLNIGEEKFEATLYLAVLQNLMTNCNEHIRQMTRSVRNDSIFKKGIELVNWGLEKNCWAINTFEEEHNLQNFIARIRNSVSHPTNIDLDSEFPSTGFSTIKDETRVIKKFRFVNSPDTRNNRQKYFTSIAEIENTIYERGRVEDKIIHNEFPKEISYEEAKTNNDIKYFLVLKGKPFIRLSIIDLSVKQLGSFVRNLANYLAQPIQENWDGVTIKELLAA